MDQTRRPEGADLLDGVEQPFDRSFSDKGRTEIRHERIADESDPRVGQMDQQCVLGFAAMDRDQNETLVPYPYGFLTRNHQLRRQRIGSGSEGPGSKEV